MHGSSARAPWDGRAPARSPCAIGRPAAQLPAAALPWRPGVAPAGGRGCPSRLYMAAGDCGSTAWQAPAAPGCSLLCAMRRCAALPHRQAQALRLPCAAAAGAWWRAQGRCSASAAGQGRDAAQPQGRRQVLESATRSGWGPHRRLLLIRCKWLRSRRFNWAVPRVVRKRAGLRQSRWCGSVKVRRCRLRVAGCQRSVCQLMLLRACG